MGRYSDTQVTRPAVGSRWWASDGANRIQARIWSISEERDGETRVFFQVDHRPEEMLNCYVGAFLQRYQPEPE